MALLPRSQQWIIGVCSIVFDIDVGQRIEYLVPDGCLSKEEQHDVAFHSFPDSMSMELHARTSIKDSTFFFRVRRRGTPSAEPSTEAAVPDAPTGPPAGGGGGETTAEDRTAPEGSAAEGAAGPDTAAAAVTNGSGSVEEVAEGGDMAQQSDGNAAAGNPHDTEERFLYGFVFCRQRQDASLRRGGEQMSVVVLAEHPLSSVLLPLAVVAGHQYFGSPGKAALQQVYDEVCRWPGPVAGPQLQLPVAFTSLNARLPAWNTLPHPSTLTASEQYGANTLPHLRSPSSRSLPPTSSSTSSLGGVGSAANRRTLSQVDDGAPPAPHPHHQRSSSGAPGVLSPSSSNASGLLSPVASSLPPPLGSPAATDTAPAPSPFLNPNGGTQAAVPPPQQHLERQGSSPDLEGELSSGTGTGGSSGAGHRISAASEISFSAGAGIPAATGSGGIAGVPPSPIRSTGSAAQGSSGPASAPPRGGGGGSGGDAAGLRQMLAEGGCSPAAVPMYPVGAVGAALGAVLQHQRSRSSVQVPSRSSSYAGALDEAVVTITASSGGSRPLPGQVENFPSEDLSGGRAASMVQGYRRVPSAPQIVAGEGGAIHGAFHEVDVYTPLSGHLPRLWQLWEMTLLGRALLLVAPTPGETSAGVAALLSLIAPLPYAADFRPFYCIHDAAFSRLASGALPGPEARDVPALLGVTNLYFIRALPHWPNVLSIGKREGAVAAVQPTGSLAASMFRANAAVQALRQRTQGASVLLSGHTEALWSTYKPLCRPDQALLNKLMQPKPGDVKSKVARIALVNSDLIRRHFAELTSAFLSPFSRYFEPDPEPEGGGRVPGWNSEEFLFGLRSGGVPLPQPLLDRVGSPSAAVELYARFTSCLNFAAWFAARRRHVAHLIAPPWSRRSDEGRGEGDGELQGGRAGGSTAAAPAGSAAAGGRRAAAAAAASEEDEEGGIASWFSSAAQHLDEVKLIGLYFSVEQQLMEAQVEAASPDAPEEVAATVSRLQRELVMLFFGGRMPEELQLTCVSSPARRALLEGLPLNAAQAGRVQQLLDMLQVGGK